MNIRELSVRAIASLTIDQIAKLEINCDSFIESASIADHLLYPIVNPSGIWADFNPVSAYYERIIKIPNLINCNCFPPAPDPSDYTDFTSPRSAIWT